MKKINLVQPRLNYYFPVYKLLQYIFLRLLSKRKSDTCAELSRIFSTNTFFFFNSGHAALQFFLSHITPGTRVGVQPLTCNTVFESIKNAGCEVVFVDINSDLVIDLSTLKSKLELIDILVVTHTFGNTADVKTIKSLKKDIIIIEDCCHSLLSKHNGKFVGTDGDAAFFSHGIAKFPSVFNGGFLLINNFNLLENCVKSYLTVKKPAIHNTASKLFKNIVLSLLHKPLIYSIITKYFKSKSNQKSYQFPYSHHVKKGYSFSKFILNSELKKITDYKNLQSENAKKIDNALKTNRLFSSVSYSNEANFFMLPAFTENPEKFIAFAESRGIEIGKHFTQMRKIVPFFGYKDGDCQNYESLISKLITFPTHYKYPAKKNQKICTIISEYEI